MASKDVAPQPPDLARPEGSAPLHIDLHRPFCDAYFAVKKRASRVTGQVPALTPRTTN